MGDAATGGRAGGGREGHVSRRWVLRLGALLGVLVVAPPLVRSALDVKAGLDANQARALPDRASNPQLVDFEIDDATVEQLWHQYMETVVDSRDGRPILTLAAWHEAMHWFGRIASVQYNQQPSATRPPYNAFFRQLVDQAVSACRQARLHLAVYFETMLISGQNIDSLQNQESDVGISRLQVGLATAGNVVRDLAGDEAGLGAVTALQWQVSNPYGRLFQPPWRDMVLRALKRNGLAQGETGVLGEVYQPVLPFLASRLPDATIGAMDLEPDIYAGALYYARDHAPDLYNLVSERYPAYAAQALALWQDKLALNQARAQLQTEAERLLAARPDLLNDLFDPTSGRERLAQVGIGEVTFGYTRDALLGYVYDQRYWSLSAQAQAKGAGLAEIGPKGQESYAPDETTYFNNRRQFVLENVFAYYQQAQVTGPAAAAQDFMADQIFNPKFQAYARQRAGAAAFAALADQLAGFERAAGQFRAARLRLDALMSALEYESEFQLPLSVMVTKSILDSVKRLVPACSGGDRNALYWQMYLFVLAREITPSSQLVASYLRPDTDGAYNMSKYLDAFQLYYQAYVALGLVAPDALPNDFLSFAQAEWKLFATKFPGQYGPDRYADDVYQKLTAAERTFNGLTAYNAWVRAVTIPISLGVVSWTQN